MGQDTILVLLGILDKYSVMDLEEQLTVIVAPHLEHSTVEQISDTSLRVICYSLPDSSIVITAPKKPTPTPKQRHEIPSLIEFRRDSSVPSLMGWEGGEIA